MSLWNCEYVSCVVGVVCTNAGSMYSNAITSASSQSQCRHAGGGGGAVRTGLSPGGGASGVLLMNHSYAGTEPLRPAISGAAASDGCPAPACRRARGSHRAARGPVRAGHAASGTTSGSGVAGLRAAVLGQQLVIRAAEGSSVTSAAP